MKLSIKLRMTLLCTLLGLFIFHRLLLWDAFADWANSASIV